MRPPGSLCSNIFLRLFLRRLSRSRLRPQALILSRHAHAHKQRPHQPRLLEGISCIKPIISCITPRNHVHTAHHSVRTPHHFDLFWAESGLFLPVRSRPLVREGERTSLHLNSISFHCTQISLQIYSKFTPIYSNLLQFTPILLHFNSDVNQTLICPGSPPV